MTEGILIPQDDDQLALQSYPGGYLSYQPTHNAGATKENPGGFIVAGSVRGNVRIPPDHPHFEGRRILYDLPSNDATMHRFIADRRQKGLIP